MTDKSENTRDAGGGLRRLVHEVRSLELGQRTSLEEGRLTVSEDEATSLLRDPALAEVRLACASPGEPVRIVNALDAAQPCSKGPGEAASSRASSAPRSRPAGARFTSCGAPRSSPRGTSPAPRRR